MMHPPEYEDEESDYFVPREEIEAWITAEPFEDRVDPMNVKNFRRSLGEFTDTRELSQEAIEALRTAYPHVMEELEHGEPQMESKKMNEVDGPYDTQAKVEVRDPVQVIKDAWDTDLNVSVTRVPGEPRMVSVKGPYEHVMGFLTQYLNMSSAEADMAIGDSGTSSKESADTYLDGEPVESGWNQRTEVTSFDRFMDNILLKETKQHKQLTEDTPQRILAKRHRERTTNRITYGKKR